MELARETPLSQNDLVVRLRLEKSTVSRLVGQLEQRGWIERQRNALDDRVLDLSLTDAGQRIAGDLATAPQAKFARLLESIPEQKRALVLGALQTLVEALREDHEVAVADRPEATCAAPEHCRADGAGDDRHHRSHWHIRGP
jgi:DNA-binding MarR family transcriptional regulator